MTDPHPLALAFARTYPGELATYLVNHDAAALGAVLGGLPGVDAAAVVARLPQGHAVRVLADMEPTAVAAWLDAADMDDAVAVTMRVDEQHRTAVLDAMDNRQTREAVRRLVVYPVTTVGALADPGAAHLRADLPLVDAVTALREARRTGERLVWLVDGAGRFVGQLDLQQALVAQSDRQAVGDWCIALRPLRAESPLVNARDVPEWLKFAELPVVDPQDRLLGSVTRERLLCALGDTQVEGSGLVADLGDLTRQYFQVMGAVLGELFGLGYRKR